MTAEHTNLNQNPQGPMPGVAIGRVVHYAPRYSETRDPNRHCFAATITNIIENDGYHPTLVNLRVDTDNEPFFLHNGLPDKELAWRERVPFDEHVVRPGSWHWPERA